MTKHKRVPVAGDEEIAKSRPGTMTKADIEIALAAMGVEGGYAAATPEQLTYARMNVLWFWTEAKGQNQARNP